MNNDLNIKNPESIIVALELTQMVVDRLNIDDEDKKTSNQKSLEENPEGFILNLFERCLIVANGGHANTAYKQQQSRA